MEYDHRFVGTGARVLMASLFLVAGVRKLMAWKMMLVVFGSLGIPSPEIVLPLTVGLEIGGGLALVAGWRLREVAFLLAGFTLITAFVGHRFWIADAAQFNEQLNNFLKNIALTGGFLVLFANARRVSPPVQSESPIVAQ